MPGKAAKLRQTAEEPPVLKRGHFGHRRLAQVSTPVPLAITEQHLTERGRVLCGREQVPGWHLEVLIAIGQRTGELTKPEFF